VTPVENKNFCIKNTLEPSGIRMTRSKRNEGKIGGGRRRFAKFISDSLLSLVVKVSLHLV